MDIQSKRVQAWADLISKVGIPLAIAVVGFLLTGAMKQKDVAVSYVNIAVTILTNKNNDASLRAWAVEVIRNYSEVKLTDEAAQSLEGHGIAVGSSSGVIEAGPDTATGSGK